ncbi:hypothetical protein HYC85_032212 [Camellia sinensis]|uniref:Uncharacterized protein n=1 Tax=Camellia sinensis TaxID=4442 RepID=A0A7J7FSU0_CAMSI|nr:hypothetical protein HYC85_032212 [Camellia sinensis]
MFGFLCQQSRLRYVAISGTAHLGFLENLNIIQSIKLFSSKARTTKNEIEQQEEFFTVSYLINLRGLRRGMIGPRGEIFSAEDADSAESEVPQKLVYLSWA